MENRRPKLRVDDLAHAKAEKRRLTMVTAYDWPTGALLDEAGVDIVLVGDSLGMVALGFSNTLPVTMDMMVHHCAAVARGVKSSFLVGDMPFMTYKVDIPTALRNAGRFLQEGNMEAVKVEGGVEVAPIIQKIVEAGIPVMGHIGLTPQSLHKLSGFKVQGRVPDEIKKLMEDAAALQEAGCFSLVLEAVPAEVGERLSRSVRIPAIGIGAGPQCDGQVLVFNDLVGLTTRKVPKFVKEYAKLRPLALDALKNFVGEVREGKFPGPDHCY